MYILYSNSKKKAFEGQKKKIILKIQGFFNACLLLLTF